MILPNASITIRVGAAHDSVTVKEHGGETTHFDRSAMKRGEKHKLRRRLVAVVTEALT